MPVKAIILCPRHREGRLGESGWTSRRFKSLLCGGSASTAVWFLYKCVHHLWLWSWTYIDMYSIIWRGKIHLKIGEYYKRPCCEKLISELLLLCFYLTNVFNPKMTSVSISTYGSRSPVVSLHCQVSKGHCDILIKVFILPRNSGVDWGTAVPASKCQIRLLQCSSKQGVSTGQEGCRHYCVTSQASDSGAPVCHLRITHTYDIKLAMVHCKQAKVA